VLIRREEGEKEANGIGDSRRVFTFSPPFPFQGKIGNGLEKEGNE